MEDKAVGRVTEAAGSLTDDETLEAEGRAGRSGAEKYLPGTCPARRGMDSGVSIGRRTKP